MKLRIVCVIHNRKVSLIGSLATFRKAASELENLEVWVYDNSSEQGFDDNFREAADYGFHYVKNGENLGLSRTYNKALSDAETDDIWLMFADDDTTFSSAYIRNVYKAIESKEPGIITGIVKQDSFVVSPMKKNAIFPKNRGPIEERGVYKDIYAINSGLTVRASLLKEIGGFEERLFLDMVDYQLMDKLKKNGKNRILVVPGTISQKLSGLDFSDKEASMRRFRIYYKDFKEYCRLTKKPLFYRIIIPLKRRINIGIHK